MVTITNGEMTLRIPYSSFLQDYKYGWRIVKSIKLEESSKENIEEPTLDNKVEEKTNVEKTVTKKTTKKK